MVIGCFYIQLCFYFASSMRLSGLRVPCLSIRQQFCVRYQKGAGSGIGREVCRILARKGTKIVVADRNIRAAKETVSLLEGSKHIALDVDVSDPEKVKNAFENIANHYPKPPTIIVNSAGITRDNFLLKLSPTDFEEVINVNLKGTFLVIQNAVKAMVEANATKDSSIVNIGSIVSKNGNIGQANYTASKAGVIALTKTASLEFGKLGIRVNAVIPGFINTPLTETVPENVMDMFIKRIPLQRTGTPQEVAEVIAFLTSDKSSYINGTSIEVTGGMH